MKNEGGVREEVGRGAQKRGGGGGVKKSLDEETGTGTGP